MEVQPKRTGYSLPRLELFLPDIEASSAPVVQAGKVKEVKKSVDKLLKKVKQLERPNEKKVTEEVIKPLDKVSVDVKKVPEKMTLTKLDPEMNVRKPTGIQTSKKMEEFMPETSDEELDHWEEIFKDEQKLTKLFQKCQNSMTKHKEAEHTSGSEDEPELPPKQVEIPLTEEQRRAMTLEAFGDSETDEEIREKVDQDELEREKMMDKETLFNYQVEKRDKARWEWLRKLKPQKEEPKPGTLKSLGRGRGGRLPKMQVPSDFGMVKIKPKPKEMFKGSWLYKQIKEIDPSILKYLMVTPGHLVDLDPYKNHVKFDIREANLFQKLCNNQRNVQTEDQVPINLEKYRKFDKLDLGEQFSLFLDCQNMTPEETRIRWQLALDLFLVLRQEYPQLEMEVTGVFLLGLGDGQSALDIFADFGNELEDLGKVRSYLAGLEDPHKEKRKMFSEVATGEGKTLLLKHEKTGILGNLYFGRGISVETDKLLKRCCELDPRVMPFLKLVCYWADIHGLTSQSYLNPFLLSLLALVHLVDKIVSKGDQGLGNLETVEGFIAEPVPRSFVEDEEVEVKAVLGMMSEFCKLSGKWDTSGAMEGSLYEKMADLIKKRIDGKLTPEMDKELGKLIKGNWEDLFGCVYKRMVVLQDLPDLQCNAGVALNVEDVKLKRFKLACEKTTERIGNGIRSLLELFKKLD